MKVNNEENLGNSLDILDNKGIFIYDLYLQIIREIVKQEEAYENYCQ